jgi:Protein of unknown function (DUF2946)
MSRSRCIDRCIRWTALVALLLATLAPSVAHALRHARGETMPWSQLCSATGSKRIVLEMPADGSPLAHGHAFDHCLFCALHHNGSAPPAIDADLPLRADLASAAPPLWLPVPRPLQAWHRAQARAPPLRA